MVKNVAVCCSACCSACCSVCCSVCGSLLQSTVPGRRIMGTKERHITQKRPMSLKRDLYHSKETCITQKRRISLKKDLYHSKETYITQKRPVSLPMMRIFGFCDMGWLRLVGSFKSQVSSAEYRLFYGSLLQKRPIILRSLLVVATP